MIDIFNNFYQGKRVLVTGHTGFKGSWLSIWLHELGAEVVGVGLEPYSEKDNYVLSGIGKKIKADIRADIRDGEKMKELFAQYQPEIVFHLAAQPLVRLSYEIPVETYQTNVMGTINIMEAIRATESVKVGVMITTDKCYDNKEQIRGYKEDDPFGGYDPYSSSKGACEIAIQSWRRSFFNPEDYGKKHHVSLASVRAGNVIGGGDWAKDRIIPDCIRAFKNGETVSIRNPFATRPWQLVLEPLAGYLRLGQMLFEHGSQYATGYNFGPEMNADVRVAAVAQMVAEFWGDGAKVSVGSGDGLHEATLLQLNIEKADRELGVKPVYDAKTAIEKTTAWYRAFYNRNVDMVQFTISQINDFVKSAQDKEIKWSL